MRTGSPRRRPSPEGPLTTHSATTVTAWRAPSRLRTHPSDTRARGVAAFVGRSRLTGFVLLLVIAVALSVLWGVRHEALLFLGAVAAMGCLACGLRLVLTQVIAIVVARSLAWVVGVVLAYTTFVMVVRAGMHPYDYLRLLPLLAIPATVLTMFREERTLPDVLPPAPHVAALLMVLATLGMVGWNAADGLLIRLYVVAVWAFFAAAALVDVFHVVMSHQALSRGYEHYGSALGATARVGGVTARLRRLPPREDLAPIPGWTAEAELPWLMSLLDDVADAPPGRPVRLLLPR